MLLFLLPKRAQKRLKGEDVFGHKINVNPTIKNELCKSVTGKKMKNSDFYQLQSNSNASNYPSFDSDNSYGECSGIKNDWIGSASVVSRIFICAFYSFNY